MGLLNHKVAIIHFYLLGDNDNFYNRYVPAERGELVVASGCYYSTTLLSFSGLLLTVLVFGPRNVAKKGHLEAADSINWWSHRPRHLSQLYVFYKTESASPTVNLDHLFSGQYKCVT